MPARYVTVDRETPMLLPPDLRDLVPADHLVHFVIDAIGELDVRLARGLVTLSYNFRRLHTLGAVLKAA